MNQTTKIILAITCLALSGVLVFGGALIALSTPTPPSMPSTPSQTPQDSTTTPDAGDESTQPIWTAEMQNNMMLTNQSFTNPENKYRALKLYHDMAVLRGNTPEQIVEMFAEYGFGGVVTNPPHDASYLQSPETLETLNDVVQALHAKGYRVWLYDEKGYPSGSAGNLTVKGHPEYEAVRLLQIKVEGNGASQQMTPLPDDFVKLEYALLQTGDAFTPIDAQVNGNNIFFPGVDGSWTAYIYCVTRYNYVFESNASYPTILNRDAVARFIEVTYDAFEGAIDNFPEIVEAFFNDEAQLLANHHKMPEGLTNPVIPYDYDIFDTFAAKYGYDVRPYLPLIYSGESEQAQRVRAQFYAHIGDLVAENYFGQIQEWCEAHSTQLSGHLLLEEQMYYHVPVYGNYIQCSQNMGYPGFDILDVRPASYLSSMSTGGKYASSAAWLNGKEYVNIEVCPVASGEEFATNHLECALGTMTLAYFDGGNQVTSYYTQANTDPATAQVFNTYVGRLGSMVVGAQNLSQVAIYYSIDAVAASYETPITQNLYSAATEARQNDKLVQHLTENVREAGLDYVFLDDDSLQNGNVTANGLQVGNFTFTTILVPRATVMDIESMRALDALIEKGVNVIFVESMPSIALREEDQAEMDALVQKHESLLCSKYSRVMYNVTTKPELRVESTAQHIYVSPYEKDGVKFFFLANTSNMDAIIALNFEGAVGYRIYDPVSGEIFEVEDAASIQSYRALFVQPLLVD